MTILERACAAFIDNLREQGDFIENCGAPEWAQVEGAFRVEPVVRAVLTAIREPSEGMLSVDPSGPTGNIFPDDLWRAMIDAALADGSR